MKKKEWIKIMCLGMTVLLLSLAGCTTQDIKTDTLNIRLKWLHQTQFAGFYVADQEGYYADEHLDVTLNEINLSKQNSIGYILSGEDDICIASADEAIISRSEGNSVRVIAVVFQIVPIVYISYEETGISKPADLINKTIALSPAQATYLYEAMLKQQNVNRSLITEISAPSYNFIDNLEVADVSVDYATNGLARATYEGINVTALWPKDYGISFYGDVIVVTDDFIENNPDIIERFIRATIKGWEKAIEEPELAVSHVLAYNPTLEEGFQLVAMNACIPLVDTGDTPIGGMTQDIWQRMHNILFDQEIIATSFNITSVFTSDFL